MKKLFLILLFITSINSTFSQIINPIKWKTSVEKLSETEHNLVTTAILDEGWHLYSQNIPKGGPLSTNFKYIPNSNYKLIGITTEGNGSLQYDKTFKMQIKYFVKQATFKQKIKLLTDTTIINTDVEFMVCNEVSCLPPNTKSLVFNILKRSRN